MPKKHSKTGDPAVGSTRLLGCPFCGGDAAFVGTPKSGWRITCTWPGCMIQLNWSYRKKSDAKKQWNIRQPNAGYRVGLFEGSSRLRTLSSVVPDTASKIWIIKQAGIDAEILEQKARETP